MSLNITAYQQLRPCIDDAGHRFASTGLGTIQIVCERCGMTRSEATR